MREYPEIIQGGMGIAISNWELARTTSMEGCLGVVSGTAIETVFIRRLQQGDKDRVLLEAISSFPNAIMAKRIYNQYHIPGGKKESEPYKLAPMGTIKPTRELVELQILASYVEVYLAKSGHSGMIGMNLLEKIQLPTLPVLFGAILASVDCILMGAGIPISIPGALDSLASWQKTSLKLHVDDNPNKEEFFVEFDPKDYLNPVYCWELKRPDFFAIVSSEIVAKNLLRKATGSIEGFIVENHTAGGHNAPPRSVDASGNKNYGDRDQANIQAFVDMNVPFWLAGGFATKEGLNRAIRMGANGIQIGSAFALCEESGMQNSLKRSLIQRNKNKYTVVKTDFNLSPTHYPFKSTDIDENEGYVRERRSCDLGYLRTPFNRGNGEIGYRCAGEPTKNFLAKGGKADECEGKTCLCNRLLATAGYPQTRMGNTERPLITTGDDLSFINELTQSGKNSYSAKEIIDLLRK